MSDKSLTFWERNRRSGGYLLRKNIMRVGVSVCRAMLLFGLCFLILQPILNKISISFMEERDLYDTTVVVLPRHLTLDNFKLTSELMSFPRALFNTFWVSLLVSVLQVISCTLVGYGFARFQFPLKKLWFGCVILVIIIPPQTIATSLYLSFQYFDIFGIIKAITGSTINIRKSLVPYSLMSLTCMGLKNGLYIYMIRQHFRSVPKSLEEAAYVDGSNAFSTFIRVMLPNATTILVSCFLFSFVWQWTDRFYTKNFLTGYTLLSSELSALGERFRRYFSVLHDSTSTASVGAVQQIIGTGVLMAAIPLILLYVFAQRRFVESLTTTGMKM